MIGAQGGHHFTKFLSLARSSPFRALLVGMLVCGLVVAATVSAVSALTLSPDQLVRRAMGEARAVIVDNAQEALKPGMSFSPPAWANALEVKAELRPLLKARVTLTGDAGRSAVASYFEASASDPILIGRYTLTSGALPSQPGECSVTEHLDSSIGVPLGSWDLRVVGRIHSVFEPDDPLLLCAPGTWHTWRLTKEERQQVETTAIVEWSVNGDLEQIQARVPVGEGWELRTPAADVGPVSSLRLLGLTLPLLLLAGCIGLVMSLRIGRWSDRVSEVLLDVGVPPVSFKRSVQLACAIVGAAGSATGLLLGSVVALIARPVLLSINHQVPLSPPAINPELVAVPALAALGSAAGAAVSAARRDRRKPRRKTTGVVSRRIAGLLTGIGVLILVTSGGSLSWMVAGSVILLAGVCALGPTVTLWWASTSKGSHTPNAGLLSRRLAWERRASVSLLVASLAAVIGSVAVVFTLATGSGAANVRLFASPVPPGIAALEAVDVVGQPVPATILTAFEQQVSSAHPIRAVENLILPDRGYLWTFDSVADAERVLNPLPEAVRKALAEGAIVTKYANGQPSIELLTSAGQRITVRAIGASTDVVRRFDTAGFAVAAQLPEEAKPRPADRVWNVYVGLASTQDQKASSFVQDSGMTAAAVLANRPDADLAIPLWTALALCGFGIGLAPIVYLAVRGQAKDLRPTLHGVEAIGMPTRWIRQVVVYYVGFPLLASSVMALVASAGVVVVLWATYGGLAFDPVGIPWWILLGFFLGLAAAGLGACLGAIRRLSRADAPDVV